MEHGDIVLFRFLCGSDLHFVGYGAGKEDHQVGIADLLFHRPVFFGKDFGFVAVFLTDLLITADHALISADDDDTHILTFLSAVSRG